MYNKRSKLILLMIIMITCSRKNWINNARHTDGVPKIYGPNFQLNVHKVPSRGPQDTLHSIRRISHLFLKNVRRLFSVKWLVAKTTSAAKYFYSLSTSGKRKYPVIIPPSWPMVEGSCNSMGSLPRHYIGVSNQFTSCMPYTCGRSARRPVAK
jgi:hypothetical protein